MGFAQEKQDYMDYLQGIHPEAEEKELERLFEEAQDRAEAQREAQQEEN